MLIGAVPLVALAVLTEDPMMVEWSPAFAGSLVGLALPGTAVVYGLWVSVLASTPLNRANAFSFLVPIFGLAIGISLYGEPLTLAVAIGSAIVIGGVAIVHHAEATAGTDNATPDHSALTTGLPFPSSTAEDP